MLKKNIMKLNDLLKNCYENIEKDKSNIREIFCFVLFCVGTIFLSFFHEPWYDEFQAWAISKDSLYNILFVIPHFEGHPPLWHLILKCFSYFNVHSELCIKIPNLLFMIASVWLIIFKSPFPRIVRITLPFTYFIFYQYSIVNRPYSIFVFAMFLTAILYKNKDTHPFKFIGSLALLCLSSIYGMLISTGFVISWVIEIWNKQNFAAFIKSFVKDKRFYSMLLLFFLCCLLTLEIFPDKINTSQTALDNTNIMVRFLYFYFGVVSDSTIFDLLNYITMSLYMKISFNFVLGIIFGCYLFYIFTNEFKKINKLSLFLILYLLFITFCFCFYMCCHHIGLLSIVLISCFWCAINTASKKITYSKQFILILAVTIIVQLYWSVCAYVGDFRYDYAPSRQVSSYIKEKNLDKYKLLSNWIEIEYYIDEKGNKYYMMYELNDKEKYITKKIINTNCQYIPVIVNPYFDRNMFYNFNVDYPDKKYDLHRSKTNEQNEITKNKWKKMGIPDIVVEDALINTVWDKDFTLDKNYISIKTFYSGFIWKNKNYSDNRVEIYAHKNLYDKLKS